MCKVMTKGGSSLELGLEMQSSSGLAQMSVLDVDVWYSS